MGSAEFFKLCKTISINIFVVQIDNLFCSLDMFHLNFNIFWIVEDFIVSEIASTTFNAYIIFKICEGHRNLTRNAHFGIYGFCTVGIFKIQCCSWVFVHLCSWLFSRRIWLFFKKLNFDKFASSSIISMTEIMKFFFWSRYFHARIVYFFFAHL